jgi:CBS domain-containing protein
MKVQDVMVKKVSVCESDNNLAQVASIMWNERCGLLPVLDSRGKVMSVITDRDVCIALGTRNLRASEVQVKNVSPPRVFSCAPTDDIVSALDTMVSQNVRRLPVIGEDGKLAGILSIDDVLLHSESYENVVNAAKTILKDRSRESVHEPAELIAVEHASGR